MPERSSTPSSGSPAINKESLTLDDAGRLAEVFAMAGYTRGQLRALLAEPSEFIAFLRKKKESLDPTIKSYLISIDRALGDLEEVTWNEEFRDGKHYDWVYDKIRKWQAALCPRKQNGGGSQGPYRTEAEGNKGVKTVWYNRAVTTEQVLADLDGQGLRPATFEELHGFGKAYPELQRRYPIVALGSRVPGSGGSVGVPVLYEDGSGRLLNLYWDDPQDQWDPGCRFLALPK